MDAKEVQREWRRTLRLIRKYVDGFKVAAGCGEVAAPGGGDCFFCLMRNKDNHPLGDAIGDDSHLVEHIREGYYVPSMLINAIDTAHFGDPEFIKGMYLYEKVEGEEYRQWAPIRFFINWYGGSMTLRKYLQKRLWPIVQEGGRI